MAKSLLAVSFAAEFAMNKMKAETTYEPITGVELHMWKKVKPESLVGNSIGTSHDNIQMKKCLNLPTANMIFTEPNRKFLQVYNETGSFLETIYLSGRPFDIAIISNKLIAISYGEGRYVEILDLKTKNIIQTFYWDKNCLGISCIDDELYVVIEGRGIVVLDYVSGQTIRTLPVKINQKSFLLVTRDSIIFTNWIFNTVHCYGLNGKEKWVFKKSKLIRPVGITADKEGNVFVAGNVSDNIFFISADGKKCKELVRDHGFMDVHFDTRNYRLLALKSDGSAFKYFVQS